MQHNLDLGLILTTVHQVIKFNQKNGGWCEEGIEWCDYEGNYKTKIENVLIPNRLWKSFKKAKDTKKCAINHEIIVTE